MEDEKRSLISLEEDSRDSKPDSRCTHKLALLALLALQFCHLTTDSFLIPFYPSEAFRKGLTQAQIGVVYSAYELTRFLSAPIFGSLVSFLET